MAKAGSRAQPGPGPWRGIKSPDLSWFCSRAGTAAEPETHRAHANNAGAHPCRQQSKGHSKAQGHSQGRKEQKRRPGPKQRPGTLQSQSHSQSQSARIGATVRCATAGPELLHGVMATARAKATARKVMASHVVLGLFRGMMRALLYEARSVIAGQFSPALVLSNSSCQF